MTASRLQSRALLPLFALLLLLAGCDTTIQIGDPGAEGPLETAVENRGDWAWAPVEGASCRDGSSTGFGARLRDESSSLLIYLEGGGACFNDPTCSKNTDSFGQATFDVVVTGARGTEGIFNTDRSENPFAGSHAAYVPYCTGDVHAGSAPDTRVEGVDRDGDGQADLQQFVGHENFERYLDVLSGRFAGEVERVVLAGSSAGGYGALVNYESTRAAFPDARVTLLNDSGPPVASDDVLTPELETHWLELWNVQQALSSEAQTAVQNSRLAAIYENYARRFPEASFGLLSFREDGTIRDFYGYRQPECDAPAGCVSGKAYAQALADVRDRAPAWDTYFADGSDHTFLVDARFYDTSVSGTSLPAWTTRLLNGNASDVAPAAN